MFHVKHEVWDLLDQASGRELDTTARGRLSTYTELALERAMPAGMVGRTDAEGFAQRHLADSLRVVPLLDARHIADAGTGAGLPGVPVAIALPDVDVTLIEQRRQRIAFLELVAERIALPRLRIVHAGLSRVEERFDVVLARAIGDATDTWRRTRQLLRPGGRVVYWAGERFDAAIDGPPDAACSTVGTSTLAMAGPLVIMAQL